MSKGASFALLVAVVLSVTVTTVRVASANDGGAFWSKTTDEQAVAHFTVGDPAHLVTDGVVQVVRTMRGSSFIGVEVIDKVSLQARLRLCDPEGCRTVWTAGAKADITAAGGFQSSGLDSASLETQLPVTVKVRDYNDSDGDGDRNEVIATFTATVPLTIEWIATGEPSSTCTSSVQEAGLLADSSSTRSASFTGAAAGHQLNVVSAEMSRREQTLYEKGSTGKPCAD